MEKLSLGHIHHKILKKIWFLEKKIIKLGYFSSLSQFLNNKEGFLIQHLLLFFNSTPRCIRTQNFKIAAAEIFTFKISLAKMYLNKYNCC